MRSGKEDNQQLKPGISVVMPAYNEEKNITSAVSEVQDIFSKINLNNEIIIVNDGSDDNTGKVAELLAKKFDNIIVIQNNPNLGLGGAYKAGVIQSKMSHIIMVPGDNAHTSDDIIPILEKIGEADIIIPYIKNPKSRKFSRALISRSYTTLVNLLFGLKIPYYNGLVLHKRDLLNSIQIETNSFAYQTEALIKLMTLGATFETVAVTIHESSNHKSTALRSRNIAQVFHILCKLFLQIRFGVK